MKNHRQTTEALNKSIREANAVLRIRTKELEEIKAQTERTKILIDKLNELYNIPIHLNKHSGNA